VRAGARYLNVRLGATNLKGSSDSTVSPVGGVGVGYAFAWSPRLFASVEAHVDLTFPVQVVDAANDPLVWTGRMFWGLDLTTAIALP
jgi:hypothetical protein